MSTYGHVRQTIRRPAALVLGLVAAAGGLAACGAKTANSVGVGPNGSTTSQCVPGPAITQTVSTANYVMVLDAGPAESMYGQAYVTAHHIASGEVMISGQMTMVPGLSMGGMSMGGMSMGASTTATTGSTGSTKTTTAKSKGSTTTTAGAGMAGMSGSSGSMAGMAGMSGSSTGTSAVPASSYRHLEIHICSRSTGKVLSGLNPAIKVVDDTAHDMSTPVPVAVMQGINQPLDLHYGNNVVMPPGRTFTVTVTLGTDKATFHVSRPST